MRNLKTWGEHRAGHTERGWAWAEKRKMQIFCWRGGKLFHEPGGNFSGWVSEKTTGFQKCCRLFQKCQQTPTGNYFILIVIWAFLNVAEYALYKCFRRELTRPNPSTMNLKLSSSPISIYLKQENVRRIFNKGRLWPIFSCWIWLKRQKQALKPWNSTHVMTYWQKVHSVIN